MINVSPQPGAVTTPGYGKNKASPKVPRSPKRSQKSSGSRAPKTTKQRKGTKKGVTTSQQSSSLKLPSSISIMTGQSIDHDTEQQSSTLPMLSTTRMSDDGHVSDHSSSEENPGGFSTFASNFSKHELSNATPSQWLLPAEDSDSNVSDE